MNGYEMKTGIRVTEYRVSTDGDLEEIGISEVRDCINVAPFTLILDPICSHINVSFFEHTDPDEEEDDGKGRACQREASGR